MINTKPRIVYKVRPLTPREMDAEEIECAELEEQCKTCTVPEIERGYCETGACAKGLD